MKRSTKIFGFTDIHWSDRDPLALAVAEKAQRTFKPDHTVIGGDLLNCGPFSRHPIRKIDEDAEYDLVHSELEPAAKFLDRVAKHTKKTTMLEGNHDEWLERWIRRTEGGQALKSLLPKNYLSDGRANFTYVPFTGLGPERNSFIKLAPSLIAVHGWGAPKHAAERHLQLAKPYSIIYHHTHRSESRIAAMCDGKISGAWSAGCLCKRTPIYAHGGCPTEWTHGFWVAYVGRGSFTVYNVPIHAKGFAILPDGEQVKV